jgi:hypothetical protein
MQVALFYAAHRASESFLIMDQNMWEAELGTVGGFYLKTVYFVDFHFCDPDSEFH